MATILIYSSLIKHMLKKYLKERVPDIEQLRTKYKLGFLGNLLLAPRSWHFHRQAVARGVALGLFIGMLPLPAHMIIAASIALLWPANLPIAILATWITNPFTLAPISYFEYLIGIKILGWPEVPFHIEWKWQWLARELAEIWEPIMIGGLLLGILLSVCSYWLVLLAWRLTVMSQWKKREDGRDKPAS